MTDMAEILVLVDHVDGAVTKTTTELLTHRPPPRRAVRGVPRRRVRRAPQATLAEYGAAKVYVVRRHPALDGLPRGAEGRGARRGRRRRPRRLRCWSPSTAEGKEIAARLAVKLGSGLITDAVDVGTRTASPTQSVFAGSSIVTAKVTNGTPIIAVKPNAATPEAGRRGRRSRAVERRPSRDAAKGAARSRAVASAQKTRPPRADRGRDRGLRRPRRGRRRGLRRRSRRSPTRSAPRSARRARRPTPAGTRTRSRSARPARPSRRSSTSPTASPARSSTGPACRPRRRSSRSTRTPRRRSSSSPTSASSATCSPCVPQLTEEIGKRQGAEPAGVPTACQRDRATPATVGLRPSMAYLDHAATTPMLPEAVDGDDGGAAPWSATPRRCTPPGGGPAGSSRSRASSSPRRSAPGRARWSSPAAAPRPTTSRSRACTGPAGPPTRAARRVLASAVEHHAVLDAVAAGWPSTRAPRSTGCRWTGSAGSTWTRCAPALAAYPVRGRAGHA